MKERSSRTYSRKTFCHNWSVHRAPFLGEKLPWVRNWQFLTPPHDAWIHKGPMPNRLIGPTPWASPYPYIYCTYCAHVGGAVPQAVHGMVGGGNPYAQVRQALQITCIADHWFTLENETMSMACYVFKHGVREGFEGNGWIAFSQNTCSSSPSNGRMVQLQLFGLVSFNYILPELSTFKCQTCTLGSQDIYLSVLHCIALF